MAKEMRTLLDVNLLIALMDEAHLQSRIAHEWAADAGAIATCPIVENGAIRIMSQPAYAQGATPLKPRFLADALRKTFSNIDHEFWSDDISLLDETLFDHSRIHGPQQLTDIYLLGLAVRHGGRLATFDRKIVLSAVRGATAKHLLVLP
jgi:uncharacterized protein